MLPGGHREGREWRAGSTSGEAGNSLGVHLAGQKAGVWSDFATGESGDALDLVRTALAVDMFEAIAWSRRWLGIDGGTAELPRRLGPTKAPKPAIDGDRWRKPWQAARPIVDTLAAVYLTQRRLAFADPEGRVLRFASRRARKNVNDELETHPALLALLCDACTSESCGLINIYLAEDGHDRIRDRKGKTVTGRAKGSVVMLSVFDEPTMGLVLCEGRRDRDRDLSTRVAARLGLRRRRQSRRVSRAGWHRMPDHRRRCR